VVEWTLFLKLVHVIAAIVAVGANLTYTYWIRRAALERDRLVWTMAGIRRLDNFVATPAYVVLLVTGILMVVGGLFSFQTSWILASIGLYIAVVVFGLVLYAPALKRQLAEAERDPRSGAYRDAARVSNIFGGVTLAAVLVIVSLMVTKPTLW
jgi:uncharacterized membrane protein